MDEASTFMDTEGQSNFIPICKDWMLNVDKTEEAFNKILDKKIKVLDIIEDKLNCEHLSFPSDYSLAKLSVAVYKHFDGHTDLPDGWEYLTAAWNEDNGYLGVAYFNQQHQQIVIAHRGTDIKSWGAISEDYNGIICDNFLLQMNSAITFVDQTVTLVQKVNSERGAYLKLSFTGHSLGGWLAHITTFSTKYLMLDINQFVVNNSFNGAGYHAHTVTFDSPGSKEVLFQLKYEYCLQYYYSNVDIDSLDICTYLSSPNRVNTFNTHVGTLYRVFANLPRTDNNRVLRKWVNKTKNHLFNTKTSMKRIAKCFDPRTGHVTRDEEGILKMRKVLDWPIYKSRICGENEHTNFFKNVSITDKYYIKSDFKAEALSLPFARHNTLCYKTCYIQDQMLNYNNFNSSELDFLFAYNFWHQMPFCQFALFSLDHHDNSVTFEALKSRLGSININLKSKTISFARPEHLDFVKSAIHFCPNLVAPNVPLQLLKIASKEYLAPFQRNCLDFDPKSMTMKKMLENKSEVYIQVEKKTFTGVLKIYKIFEKIKDRTEYNKDNCLFLDINTILSFSKYVCFATFLEKINTDFLLVIECNDKSIDMACCEIDVFLTKLQKIVSEKIALKLILCVNTKSTTPYTDIFPNYRKSTHLGIHFYDLDRETREVIVKKKLISLQGKLINLDEIDPSLNHLHVPLDVVTSIHEKSPVTNYEKTVEFLINSEHDIFAISNIESTDLQTLLSASHNMVYYKDFKVNHLVRFVIVDGAVDFDDLCCNFAHKARIHWLDYNGEQLILKDSNCQWDGDHDSFLNAMIDLCFREYHEWGMTPNHVNYKEKLLNDVHVNYEEKLLDGVLNTRTLIQLGNDQVIRAGKAQIVLCYMSNYYVPRQLSINGFHLCKIHKYEGEYLFLITDIQIEAILYFKSSSKKKLLFYEECFLSVYYAYNNGVELTELQDRIMDIIKYKECVIVLNEDEVEQQNQFLVQVLKYKVCRLQCKTKNQWHKIGRVRNEQELNELILFTKKYPNFAEHYDTHIQYVVANWNTMDTNDRSHLEDVLYKADISPANIPDRVVVVSGIPGIGKSTFFTKLALDMKYKDPSLWVIKIDLISIISKLRDKLNEVEKSDIDSVLNVKQELIEYFLDILEVEKYCFEAHLFEYYLCIRKIVFIFDGFDEICPLYGNIFLKLIENLTSLTNVKQIWLSSRPCALKNINIEALICKLNGFDDNVLIWFLENHLNYMFRMYDNDQISSLFGPLNDESQELISVSLFLTLFADNTLNTLDKKTNKQLYGKMNVQMLYKGLIDNSFKRFSLMTDDDTDNQTTIEYYKTVAKTKLLDHKLIAAYFIFGQNLVNVGITSMHELNRIKDLIKWYEEKQETSGVITSVVDGTPKFVHRAFAEYLATWWLVQNLNQADEKDKNKLFKFLCNEILMKNEWISFVVVNKYLDTRSISGLTRSLDKRVLLSFAASNGCIKLIKLFFKSVSIDFIYSDKATDKKKLKEYFNDLLYSAIKSHNNITLLCLLHEYEHSKLEDITCYKLYALSKAIECNIVSAVKHLLSNLKLTFDLFLKACNSIQDEEMTRFAIDFVVETFPDHLNDFLAAKYAYGDTLLHVAVKNEFNGEVINEIIKLSSIEHYADWALAAAAIKDWLTTVNTILNLKPSLRVIIESLFAYPKFEILKVLIEFIIRNYGDDGIQQMVTARYRFNYSILHLVALRFTSAVPMIETLVTLGADIRSRDDVDRTPASIIAEYKSSASVHHLLSLNILNIDDIIDAATFIKYVDIANCFIKYVNDKHPQYIQILENILNGKKLFQRKLPFF